MNRTYGIEEFTYDLVENVLTSKEVLFEWGWFPGAIYISGRTRTVKFSWFGTDMANQLVEYRPEEAGLPKLFLLANSIK